MNPLQCTLDISRLVGSIQWYRDISGSAIYRVTCHKPKSGSIFQHIMSDNGAFVLAANSAHRQQIRAATSTDFGNRFPKFEPYPMNRTVRIPLWGPMLPRVHGQGIPTGTPPPIIASCLVAGFKSN